MPVSGPAQRGVNLAPTIQVTVHESEMVVDTAENAVPNKRGRKRKR